MKQFERHRTADEVLALAAERGITVNTEKLDQGGDYLSMNLAGPDGESVLVLYNVFNGRFFHAPESGIGFASDREGFDGQPWFDAMLDLFYVEQTATTAQ